jgi:MFS family permease
VTAAAPQTDDPIPGRWASLAAAIGCGGLSAAGFGLVVPSIALNLDDWGFNNATIGLFTTIAGISTILFTPLCPWLIRKLGARRLLLACVILGALLMMAFPAFPHPIAWLAIRFCFSAVLTALFVASEAWLVELAPPKRRGILIGAYASILAGCYGLGGLIIAAVGYKGFTPYLIGAGIFLLGLLPLLLKGPDATPPAPGAARLSVMAKAFTVAPLIFLAPLVMAAIETALFNLGPIYARDRGFSDQTAALVITAMALGNLTLQVPIGWATDKIGPHRMMLIAASVAVAGPFLIYLAAVHEWALYASLFFYSGFVTALYLTALTLLGRRFPPDRLATGNASFAMAYGLGQLSSPVFAGPAMDKLGPQGLLWALGAVALLFLTLALFRMKDLRG